MRLRKIAMWEVTDHYKHQVAGIQGGHKATETNQGNMTRIQLQQQQQKEATEKSKGFPENSAGVAEPGNESAKRSLEFPLFLTAGIAYVLVGFRMVKDRRSSKSLYIIAMAGSLTLIGLYTVSHTVGEHVVVLDLLVAALQIGIVGCSGYVILSGSEKRITTSAERSM